jgi:hypothetical protein
MTSTVTPPIRFLVMICDRPASKLRLVACPSQETVGIRHVVLGLVVDVVDRETLLLAFILDDARLAQYVDGGAAHLVDEVVRLHGEVLGELLAHQHRLAGDVHAAALVGAVEEIGAVVG